MLLVEQAAEQTVEWLGIWDATIIISYHGNVESMLVKGAPGHQHLLTARSAGSGDSLNIKILFYLYRNPQQESHTGQVTKVWLSWYLVLLSVDSKTR